jgi:recombination protein RecA
VIYEGGGEMEGRLTSTQKALLIGSLLGDGHLRSHREGVVFEFLQSAKRRFYVEWKHGILGDLACPQIYHSKDEREYYKLVTKTHPELTKLHGLFYKGGRKTVPEQIGKILTPFAIAVWFMDDGSKSRNAVYFNTQGFDVPEQLRLIRGLRRFHIIANLNRDGEYFRLRVLKRCNEKFLRLVRPHVLDEFAYKLPTL